MAQDLAPEIPHPLPARAGRAEVVQARPKMPHTMSAQGHHRTFCSVQWMSALPPKADVVRHGRDVRSVPKPDIRVSQKS